MPLAQEPDQDVGGGAVVQELRNKVQVADQSRLQDDGHVGRVEELDGVRALLSSELLVLDGQVDAPPLEVNDNDKHQDRRHQVGQVGQVLPVQRLAEGPDLVGPGDEQVEERDDGALELGPAPRVDGGGGEGLPDDGLANVGGNEERNAGAEPVPLLEQLVERQHNQPGAEELGDDEDGVPCPDRSEVPVHSRDDVGDGLSDRDENPKELLRPAEEGPILLDAVVDLNDSGAGQQLHDHPRRDDGRDPELHEGPAVGRHDDADPVEGVGRLGALDPVNGDLAAHEEDEEGDGRPQELLAEGDLQQPKISGREEEEEGALDE